MKKIIIILGVFAMALSSCLKDKPNVDFSNLGIVAELVESGKAYFSQDAITSTKDTISGTFTLNIASPNIPTSDISVTIGVDTTQTAKYNAYNSTVSYITMPTNAYVFPTQTVTIKAGTRLATLKYTIYKNKLSPSLSYMLPIAILNTSQGIISGNFGVHYYHIIGNDFAGTYTRYYTRYNASDSLSVAANPKNQSSVLTVSPVNPTQFEVASGYYTQPKYEVTYTKNGSGSSATYTNFAVTLNTDDIATATSSSSGGVTFSTPAFAAPSSGGLSSTGVYTYAQVIQRLKFINVAASSGSPRYTVDRYIHN